MSDCGCGCNRKPEVELAALQAPPAPVVRSLSTEITWRDVLGGWRVRWGVGRMDYRRAPGLYRVGSPDADSPVLVTANYKLTVDAVRRELRGHDAWLLVLDTKGVNVWCAAGKGTFGTAELVQRIRSVNLAAVVRHRELIVPQLGATGVAAHEVKSASGFSVRYGPVRASDLPAYLAAGMRATPAMRRVTFGWKERLVVAPMEVSGSLKTLAAILAVLAALTLIRYHRLTPHFAADSAPFLAAIVTGGLLVPLLLPWLPFRYFALKGAVAGAAMAVALRLLLPAGVLESAATSLLVVALTSYMAMMFTGSTTFTTLAGARLEVRRALPVVVAGAIIGAALRVTAFFV